MPTTCKINVWELLLLKGWFGQLEAQNVIGILEASSRSVNISLNIDFSWLGLSDCTQQPTLVGLWCTMQNGTLFGALLKNSFLRANQVEDVEMISDSSQRNQMLCNGKPSTCTQEYSEILILQGASCQSNWSLWSRVYTGSHLDPTSMGCLAWCLPALHPIHACTETTFPETGCCCFMQMNEHGSHNLRDLMLMHYLTGEETEKAIGFLAAGVALHYVGSIVWVIIDLKRQWRRRESICLVA